MTSILTGKRNATVKFCHVLHVAHNHELHKLTMTRILNQASGLFQCRFVYQVCWLIYMPLYIFYLLSLFSFLVQNLDVSFLLPVIIYNWYIVRCKRNVGMIQIANRYLRFDNKITMFKIINWVQACRHPLSLLSR